MKKVYLLVSVMIFAAAITGCKKSENISDAPAANAPQTAVEAPKAVYPAPSAVVD